MPLWVLPVVAPITQLFGQFEGEPWGVCGPGGHPGTDYGCPNGTPVVAAADGIVTFAGPASGFGDHAVSIHHQADDVTTTYGHFQAHFVTVGQAVAAGDRIGLADSQGNVTGPHLHLELRPGSAVFGAYTGRPGSNVDPDAWLRAHGAYSHDQGAPFMANMPTIDTTKALNMQAPPVRTAQALLAARGGWISGAGNTSHPVFSSVLRWFQGAAGIAVDGVCGPDTWERLAQELDGH